METGGRRGGDERRESGGMTSGGRRGGNKRRESGGMTSGGRRGGDGEGGVETREERVVE